MTNSLVINPDVLRNRQVGLCQFLHFTEENIRFVFLAVFLYGYLCIGASIFQAVEEPAEIRLRSSYDRIYHEFIANLTTLNDNAALTFLDNLSTSTRHEREAVFISEQDLLQLLYAYGNASRAGVYGAKRWNWVGSFHFAWTIVSTIGYGATTPSTTAGQLLIIPYGFFGCAGGLLFFNLFLERIITFLACCMRFYRLQRQKRRSIYVFGESGRGGGGDQSGFIGCAGGGGGGRRSSRSSAENGSTAEEEVEDWKPSVYWVMMCLLIMSSTIIFASAGMFSSMEGWSYIESLYFCFVSYATIGFGDFVSMQKVHYEKFELVYRVAAFATMVLGCCCIYSLLNVTSIVIKQNLNWLIKKLDYWQYCACCNCLRKNFVRKFSRKSRRRRKQSDSRRSSSIAAISVVKLRTITHQSSTGSGIGDGGGQPHSLDLETDMDERGRRYSSENMISLRSELTNKVSLAVMQKRLYETAQMSRSASVSQHENDFSARSVGPLAIVTEKLGENNHHHGHGHGPHG